MRCVECEHYYEDYDHNDMWSSFCSLLKGKYDEHLDIDGFTDVYFDCPLLKNSRN